MSAELAQVPRGRPQSSLNSALPALYSFAVGLTGLGVLGSLLLADLTSWPWPAILIFAGLSAVVQRSSFYFGSPARHSLAGVIDIAAILALGPVAGAAVAAGSGLAYLELHAIRHRLFTRRRLLDTPIFNAGLKAFAALAAGSLYRALGGSWPLSDLSGPTLLAALAVCVAWFVLDQLGWAILDYLYGGVQGVALFAPAGIRQAVLVELMPLPFGLILALTYVHLDLLASLIAAVAVVVVAVLARHWADTRSELVRRVADLSTIEETGRAIAQAQLDVEELCRLMYEHARRLVDTTIFHLGLFEGDQYTIKLWMQDDVQEVPRTFTLVPGSGLVGWLRESKKPILINDFAKEMDSLPAKPIYASDKPPRSAVFVPLLAGDTVIGTMSIQSFRAHAYNEMSLRLLSAMANQAALAIQKAQLYGREVRRARELETIGEVSRQVTATLELDDLFERVVHLIRQSFGYYHVAVYTADPEQETLTFQASASASGRDVAIQVAWGEGLIGWVAEHREPALANDVMQDERYCSVDALEETQSEIAVPLLLEDELVGLLDVQSDHLNAFGPEDQFILSTLSIQVAIAIQEARLYESGRQQAWFSTALLQVADATSRLTDMDEVLSSIVRLTPLLAGVDRCAILLWDQAAEAFVPEQTYGVDADLRETFAKMVFDADALPGLHVVRREKQPLLLSAEDELLLPPILAEMFDIREVLILPLLAQGELLGAMMVDYAGTPHHFSERMVNMLTGIANQAAMVIHSARLVQAQQEEAYVSTALLQVAEAVSRSRDLDEILSAIVRITPLLVGVEVCAVFLRNSAGNSMVPAQQYGLKGDSAEDFATLRLTDDGAPLRDLLDGLPFTTVAQPEAGQDGVPLAAVFGEGPLLALPLLSRSEMVGLMMVDYTGPELRFTRRWVNILTGIAGQVAMAVENHRLLQEAAGQERLRQELDVARRIQASFLPDSCPEVCGWEIAALWRSARRVGGDFYDFIPLAPETVLAEDCPNSSALRDGTALGRPEDRLGLVIADVSDKGVPAALFMALSRTLIRTVAFDGRSPSRAIGRANDLILADSRAEMFVTVLYAILEPDSGRVCFVNAGHMPPIVVPADGGQSQILRMHGMALGVLPDVKLPEVTALLERGDTLILYTDGVVEASDAWEEMFGLDRLIAVAEQHRHQPAEEMVQAISDAVAAHVGDASQFDDLTLVVARRTP